MKKLLQLYEAMDLGINNHHKQKSTQRVLMNYLTSIYSDAAGGNTIF